MSDDAGALPLPIAEITALERDIGVRIGFFRELVTEGDDWAFIVKMHALIEAGVSHLLTEVSGHPGLLDLFSELDVSNARTGKIVFGKALGCLDRGQRKTIRKLSELRNRLVHDVSNVDFNLEEWAGALDPNQARSFNAAFGPGGETVGIDQEISALQFFKENPRLNIWFACLVPVGSSLSAEGLGSRPSRSR